MFKVKQEDFVLEKSKTFVIYGKKTSQRFGKKKVTSNKFITEIQKDKTKLV